MTAPPAALRFEDVVVRHEGGAVALDGISWEVANGQRWVVLGPNGCGKTTTIQLASGYLHPTSGTVEILGHRLRQVDVRRLRERIGLSSAALVRSLRPGVTALEVVLAGRHAALETWWHDYTDDDRQRAASLLDDAGFGYLADRPFGVLSEGERQQVQLARMLMGQPQLVLLDEPAAGLDMGARELLVRRLGELAADRALPAAVFVTHHVEEIPPGFTHLLLLRRGHVVSAGPIGDALTSEALSDAFGIGLGVRHEDGRWTCRALARR